MRISNFTNRIISLFFPARCPYCNEIIKFDDECCLECKHTFPAMSIIRNIGHYGGHDIFCLSPLRYESKAIDAVRKFKFLKKKYYARNLGKIMTDSFLKTNLYNIEFDIITEVPLSKKRKKSRGYNQAELLAREISYLTNIKHESLLKKHIDNLEQHTLSAKERRKNVKGVYSAVVPGKIKGKTILICDDVVTTGSTLSECAKVLYDNGAKMVYCISLTDASNYIELVE